MNDNFKPDEAEIRKFREAILKLKEFLPDPNHPEAPRQVLDALMEIYKNGYIGVDAATSKMCITEKGKQWLGEMETRSVSVAPVPPTAPPSSSGDGAAKSLRGMFKVPNLEQMKSAFQQMRKTDKYGRSVIDKDALALMRTYAFKIKLAQELEEEIKKSSSAGSGEK